MIRNQEDDFLEKLTKTLTEVEDELRCAVCLDFFKDARLIGSCGHFFCCDCIRRLGRVRGDTVKCPECNRSYVIAVSDTEGLLEVPQLDEIVSKIKSYKQQTEKISPISPELEEKYCGQCNYPATFDCDYGLCPSCCTQRDCLVHMGSKKCHCGNRASSNCSNYLCGNCCTDHNCKSHNNCQQCGLRLTQHSSQCHRCANCCITKRCPTHPRPNICLYGNCKNKPSHSCIQGMCRVCCNDPQCPSHFSVKDLDHCSGCPMTPTIGCSENSCGDCCKDRWCLVHGKPRLCRECVRIADDPSCKEGKCFDCCDEVNCCLHKPYGCERKFCRRCENRKSTICCTYNRCRFCCKNKDCPAHNTSSLCTFCNNLYTIDCTKKSCQNCCNSPTCPVHVGQVWCTKCNARFGELRCPSYLCWACCSDPNCREHSGVRKCPKCKNKNSIKNCSMASCAECCTDRGCPSHRQSWQHIKKYERLKKPGREVNHRNRGRSSDNSNNSRAL